MTKIFSLLFVCLLLGGCTDNRRAYETPSQIRDYQTDAEIMAQFVDIDASTGLFYVNADKKIAVTDYVVNHSREELGSVSDINRDRFLSEMNDANVILKALRDAPHVSAMVYSTCSNSHVRTGTNENYLKVNRFANEISRSGFLGNVDISGRKTDATLYRLPENIQMNVAASPRSTFYVSQLSFCDNNDTDRATIVIAGVGTTIPKDYMIMFGIDANLESVKIKGSSLLDDSPVSISFSK